MFKVGEQVRHKSGGPVMTIDEISGNQLWCSWFDSAGKPQMSLFELSSLVSVTSASPLKTSGPALFISHSSADEGLARALIELLISAMGLLNREIRCSSVDGYRLPVGAHTESTLREEVKSAKVVVGLITKNSLSSAYVMFELGARWGAGSFVAPLLAGVTPNDLYAPLKDLNVLHAANGSQLHQFVDDISVHLNRPLQSPASYQHSVDKVREMALAMESKTTANRSPKIYVPGMR